MHKRRFKTYKKNRNSLQKTKCQIFRVDSTESRISMLLLASSSLALNLKTLILAILFGFFNLRFFYRILLTCSLHFSLFSVNKVHFSIQEIKLVFRPVISSISNVLITWASFKSVSRNEMTQAYGFRSISSFNSPFDPPLSSSTMLGF